MEDTAVKCQSGELTLKEIFLVELFSKLPAQEQDKIIDLIKSLLSDL